ncbi:hypothetical protein SAMN06297280_1284 [Arsukibacterium tuosuense]|uniref:Lipoprotein n=1 Tax=Arsukibacterium tuosuense TaxID=1323745 RepID=A0A285IMJ2_9GAMM|nr:hypothetical protein [Arsukibacterium tuosuense]SNY49192.1 hypothetical protein SAMN06297280_1284 [Arsukibacterium tuosuense]
MRFLIGCCLVALLVACSKPNEFNTADISEVYIADFVSDAPEQCGPEDVDLSNNDVTQFFQLAREVEHKVLHDHYNYAPCAIEGTLKLQQQSCSWQVRAGATGYIKCAEQYRYFACDNCAELFNTATDLQ